MSAAGFVTTQHLSLLQYNSQLGPYHMSQGSTAHEQCVTHCPVSCLVHLPGCLASDYWKISTQDPGITILGSQPTGLVRLSYNHKAEISAIQLLPKIKEKQSYTVSLTMFKISTSIKFLTIDKTFHNHHFISTHCNYTSYLFITKIAIPQLPHCNT